MAGCGPGPKHPQYCVSCHNDRLKTAGMSVQKLDANNIERDLATWEKILRRISVGEMPPKGMKRQSGLHEFIVGFLRDNAQLGAAISDQYLS